MAQRSGIFQHLTEADSSTIPKHGGTGLGLATCSQLAALLSGRSEVESGYAPAVMPARSEVTPVLSAEADGTPPGTTC